MLHVNPFMLFFIFAAFVVALLLYHLYAGPQATYQFGVFRNQLNIAIVAPLAERVPAIKYGGAERIISYLTEELVRRGHNVTLFAPSTSVTSAHLITKWPPLDDQLPGTPGKDEAYDWLMSEVRKRAHQFDILHFHVDLHYHQTYQIFKDNKTVVMMTAHWVMNPMAWKQYLGFPLISISNSQRKSVGLQANFVGTIYHGMPKDVYKFVPTPNSPGYLAFLGRVDAQKRPDWAIQIAIKAGIPLKIAARLKFGDTNYWENITKPMIDKNSDLVEYVGEINDTNKNTFLGNAVAFVFPIDWEEPFGMVMIEAMACGTPVVARRRGSVPEIVEEGVSGFIFDTIDEGAQAVKKARKLDRAKVRRAFEKRFTAERMVDDHEALYERMLGQRPRKADLDETGIRLLLFS